MENHGTYGDVPGYPVLDDSPLWTNKELKEMHAMARQGVSASDLALHFGRGETDIKARLYYLGLGKEAPISRLSNVSQ